MNTVFVMIENYFIWVLGDLIDKESTLIEIMYSQVEYIR